MRHVNIPVFIPHLGCPNMCVFCNQRTISGVKEFDPDSLKGIIDEALTTVSDDEEVEIAFFGGSFTGIGRELMIRLLEVAYSYVKSDRVHSIRCSTRPDYINEEILDILWKYGVRVIELGLQSSSDKVLNITKRGHSFSDEERACRLIVDKGFSLIGQMMIGLPGSSPEDEMATADFIIGSGAIGARIYPTVVFRDTELAEMTKNGGYSPLLTEDAVNRSARVFEKFIAAGVSVIRIGLCSSENLSSDETYYSGPNHPAIGELTVSKYYYDKIISEAQALHLSENTILHVLVSRGSVSKATGQKKKNKILLKKALGIRDIKIRESSDVTGYGIKLQTETEVQKCI